MSDFIPTPDECSKCAGAMGLAKGCAVRFTRKCADCGERIFVFRSPTAPTLHLWKRDCPKDVPFYDFVRNKMNGRAQEYSAAAWQAHSQTAPA